MKKLVYAKFNTLRNPSFQLATFIRESENGREVVKHPITQEACQQIDNIQTAYDCLKDYYNNIHLLKGKKIGDDIIFPYIDGEPILPQIDLDNSSLSTVKDILKETMDIIFDINEEFMTSFLPTEGFKEVFSKAALETIKQLMDKTGRNVKALRVSNPDSIFDNFIRSGNEVYCLDYEWLFDFPVPLSYLKYRSVYFFYQDNKSKLEDRINCDDFLQMFGFGSIELSLFSDMEDSFQEYIFGKGRERLYLERYKASNESYRKTPDAGIPAEKKKIVKPKAEKEKTSDIKSDSASDKKIDKKAEKKVDKDKSEAETNTFSKTTQHLKKGAEKTFLLGRSRIKNVLNKKILTSSETVKYLDKRMNELSEETEGNYDTWIKRCEEEYCHESSFAYNPYISIVVYSDEYLADSDISLEDLSEISVQSINQSIYKNYEITGLDSVKGDYVLFIRSGDRLSKYALSEIVKRINEAEGVDFIYADEDIISEGKLRELAFMKPDWSVDHFYSTGYTGDMAVFSKKAFKETVKPSVRKSGNQWIYAAVLKLIEIDGRIEHISRVLKSSMAGKQKSEEIIAAELKKRRHLLEKSFENMGISAYIEENIDLFRGDSCLRIYYKNDPGDSVSIVIPSKDNPEMLMKCIDKINNSISADKDNSAIEAEIIVVDNGSTTENKSVLEKELKERNVTYIFEKMDFNFSHMCNVGARAGKGKYILFLNDDIEVTDSGWLSWMTGQAARKWTGAVGAKLLYPGTNLIQHDGIINRKRDPIHIFSGMDDSADLYHMRNVADVDVLAVTGACLMVSRDKFEAVGGFNEDFPVAYNDLDLCFRLYKAGYFNIVRNDVSFFHHESVSRGADTEGEKYNRLIQEKDKLYAAHPDFEDWDPFYNPFLTQTGKDSGYAFERFNIYEVTPLYSESGKGRTSLSDVLNNNRNSGDLLREIDLVQVDHEVIIEGWAFRPGDIYNIDKTVQLLLVRKDSAGVSDGKSSETGNTVDIGSKDIKGYLLTTTRKRRNDVVEAFPGETAIDFSGFIARIDRTLIQPGSYEIIVLCDNKRYKTSGELKL